MADLRIVDAPEIPTENITGEEKLPTGGSGNYSISLDSLADYTKTKKDLADNTTVDGKVNGVRQELESHIEDLLNPHQVTKGQIGLGNVDNTADADKPVSNSTQAAIISAVAPKADKTYVDTALSSKTDKTYVDSQLTLKANKTDVYTKSETYTKQESSGLVNNSISTALTPVNTSLDLAKRGTANRYDSSLTYNSGERVVLTNGDIVKSTIDGNTNDPNVNMVGWVDTNDAGQIFDESGKTQQEINNMLRLSLVSDLPSTGFNGQIAMVYDDLRGGKFYYDPARSAENNGGTVFNGWVRKYFGSVYLEWFCETDPKTTDCSIYMERALSVTKGVKAGGRDFLFTGRVGIPDTDQNNYAQRTIKIHGDGDTVFHIDCKSHGRATFTSYLGKADPTSEANNFVGKVDFKGISFIGVNTNFGHELTNANKNITDIVFDGDRMYNCFATFCNFVHLKNAIACVQGRGVAIEGGNAYSQSFTMTHNHFYHCTAIVEADQLLNFRFVLNQGEANYTGIIAHSKSDSPALGVCTIDYNLFEAGGMFIDIRGDIVGGSIWNNYLEYNIFENVAVELCQVLVVGSADGCVIGANAFGGQIGFNGYDTEYVDLKITGGQNNDLAKTDYATSKPILIGNHSTSRKLTTASSSISIGNSAPYWLKNGWQKEPTVSHKNSMNTYSAQESNVTFSRGIFNQPVGYSAVSRSGSTVKTLSNNSELIVSILDLSALEGGASKNRLSTITGELDCNIDLIRDNLTIGNVSAKIHVSIFNTGFGSDSSAQYNQVRVYAKLLSIIQPFDIPIISTQPSNLMKKQFVEPDVKAIAESLGGGLYAIRLSNYLGVSVGTFGTPSGVYANLTWQASTACRQVPEQIGNNVSFIGYWW